MHPHIAVSFSEVEDKNLLFECSTQERQIPNLEILYRSFQHAYLCPTCHGCCNFVICGLVIMHPYITPVSLRWKLITSLNVQHKRPSLSLATSVCYSVPVFHTRECSCGQGSPDGAKGRPWQATDIAVQGTECKWMKCCFMGVKSNTEGGRAFVKSLYDQYASWGVDFSESYNPCLNCTYLFVVLDIGALCVTLSSTRL